MTGALATALARRGDTRPWARATVLGVDHAAGRVTVDLEGAELVLPALAGAYRPGDVVALVRDPAGSGSGQFVAGVLSAPAPIWRTGVITAIDTTAKTISATVNGAVVTMPHLTGTYAVGNTVAVLADPASRAGSLVLGVLPSTVVDPPDPLTPPEVAAFTTQTCTALIRPTWTGTWQADPGVWRTEADLAQGTSPLLGALTGLAVYGTQVADLGALEILDITATVRHNGAGGPAVVTLRGSTAGTRPSGAPPLTGATATSPTLRPGDRAVVHLPTGELEAWRTGSQAGLALVGATFAGAHGTTRPDGMALAVTYTRPI